jgi:hypothetical protein
MHASLGIEVQWRESIPREHFVSGLLLSDSPASLDFAEEGIIARESNVGRYSREICVLDMRCPFWNVVKAKPLVAPFQL